MHMSAFGGEADMAIALQMSAYDPKRTLMPPSAALVFVDTIACL